MAIRQRFLPREIKEDGRGYYIHYGSFRLRPSSTRGTRFDLGRTVAMMTGQLLANGSARVFYEDNPKKYEVWR